VRAGLWLGDLYILKTVWDYGIQQFVQSSFPLVLLLSVTVYATLADGVTVQIYTTNSSKGPDTGTYISHGALNATYQVALMSNNREAFVWNVMSAIGE
jgi:hypothetical protein